MKQNPIQRTVRTANLSVAYHCAQFHCTVTAPFSSNRQHLSYDGCLEVRVEIIRTVLCCIVYWSYLVMYCICVVLWYHGGVNLVGLTPFSSDRQHLSYDDFLVVRGEIIRTVLCCIVYWKLCTVISTLRWAVLTVLWIVFCLTGPISLCLDSCVHVFFVLYCLTAYVLYYCNAVGWTWWDWSLILEHLPSVLWHCWLGHSIRKNPSPIWPIMCSDGH